MKLINTEIQPGNEIRVCYIVNVELLKKIKALACFEKRKMWEIVERAIKDYVYRPGPVKLKNPSRENIGDDETGTTFVIKEKIAHKVKALAYWESGTIKGIFDKVLKTYINKYENKRRLIGAPMDAIIALGAPKENIQDPLYSEK